MTLELEPVAYVRGGRLNAEDDNWGDVEALIELDTTRYSAEALLGLDAFSHLVVIYHFHGVAPERIGVGARHPRNNPDWPKVGIFAQRGKNRPNRLGVSTCEIVSVSGTTIAVRGLDAIADTPVLDIKPFMRDFEPRIPTSEPQWAKELMESYW